MKDKFEIKNLLGNSQKRTYRREIFRQQVAGAVRLLIVLILLGLFFFGDDLINSKRTSPKPLEQTIEVKAVEVKAYEIPCDYDAITYIRCRGQQLGYKDTDISVFVRIARAESNFNPLAKNKSSTATGIYQFINGTFHRYCAGKNVYNFVDNIDCFYKVLETDGYPKALNHWNASRSKWEK